MIIAAKIYDRYLHLNENETKNIFFSLAKPQTRFAKWIQMVGLKVVATASTAERWAFVNMTLK